MRLFLARVSVLFACLTASGQESGGLKGVVVVESSLPIAGADVQLMHSKNPTVYKRVQTASNGTFQFNDVLPGTYDVKVWSPGFPTFIRQGVRIRSGEVIDLPPITLLYRPAQ